MNILAFVLIFLMYYLTDFIDKNIFDSLFLKLSVSNGVTLFLLYVLWLVLHEIIHGVAYILGGAKPNKVVFGAILEKSIFYCLCKQDITIKAAKRSVLAPLIYIGVFTYIIGFVCHLPMLIFLSITNIAGAAGDILTYAFLSRLSKDSKFSEFDDATSFAILSNKNLSKYKPLGLKFSGTKKSLIKEDMKKITISKATYIYLIIAILGILITKLFLK